MLFSSCRFAPRILKTVAYLQILRNYTKLGTSPELDIFYTYFSRYNIRSAPQAFNV